MNISLSLTSNISKYKHCFFIGILICLSISIADADEWYEYAKRSILRGAGRPFPAHELFNLQRSVFYLPPMPEPIPNSTLLPKSTEWNYISIHSQQDHLQQVLQNAIQHQQQKSTNIESRTLLALLLVTKGLADQDTNYFLQAKLILLSLPSPPKSGGFARNDIGGIWGDLLESSYSLSYASIVYDVIRSYCTSDEQKKISQVLFQLCFRIQNGVEFIGPNNHALVSGSNMAQALVLFHQDDWEGYESYRQPLWQLSERLMQIGLAQVGKDGVYREGPGYAQEVLFSITRLAYLLKLRTNFNLFRTPILSKLVTTTSQLTNDVGNPLPFDDTFPVGGNLWQSLATFFPANYLIQKFANVPLQSSIHPEGLFLIVRFPKANYSVEFEPSTQEIYVQDGVAIWREPQQWVVAMSGEPKETWTGRHEQLDIGNVCIAIGDETIVTSGGYGKQGVYDDARRYWLSGEAFSAFLVNNQPLVEWVGSPLDENQAQWTATKWNDDGMFAKLEWKQNGVDLSRTFLRVGKRLVLIDETNEETNVLSQFICDGIVSSPDIGEWKIVTASNQRLTIQTLPKTEGVELKGIITPYAGGEKIVTRLRMPIQKTRIVLFTPNENVPALYYETISSDNSNAYQLSWIENDGSAWTVSLDIHSKVFIQHTTNRNEQFCYFNDNSQFHIQWIDEFGTALFPKSMMESDSNLYLIQRWRNALQPTHTKSSEVFKKDSNHWYVYGKPTLRIREVHPTSETPILSRLSTLSKTTNFSDWYPSQPRETQAQMERDGLDSMLSYSKSALDTLGLHTTLKIVTALIDATTDGFAPNVFRVPFDVYEQSVLSDSSMVSIQSRGRWGSGFQLENFQLRKEKQNRGWEIQRSNHHPRLEYYQVGLWNPFFSISADHSDRYLSGISNRIQTDEASFSFRTEMRERQWMHYKSYGSIRNHSYSLVHTRELNTLSYHTNFSLSPFNLFTGGRYSQQQMVQQNFSQGYLHLSLPTKFYSSLQIQKQQKTDFASDIQFIGNTYQYRITSTNTPSVRVFHFGKLLVPSIWGTSAYSNFRFIQKNQEILQLQQVRYPFISLKRSQYFAGIRKESQHYFHFDATQKNDFGYVSIETGTNLKKQVGAFTLGILKECLSISLKCESFEDFRSIRSALSYSPLPTSNEYHIEFTWFNPISRSLSYEKKWDVRLEIQSLTKNTSLTQSVDYTQLQTGETIAQGGFTFYW